MFHWYPLARTLKIDAQDDPLRHGIFIEFYHSRLGHPGEPAVPWRLLARIELHWH
jgi:hypothetical protein